MEVVGESVVCGNEAKKVCKGEENQHQMLLVGQVIRRMRIRDWIECRDGPK